MPDKTARKHAFLNGGINLSDASSGNVTGLVEEIPYKLLKDGSRLYNWHIARRADPLGTQFHDVMVFSKSVLHLGVEEVRVYPNGWGYVLVQKLEDPEELSPFNQFGEIYTWPDGRALNHYLYGYIEIV